MTRPTGIRKPERIIALKVPPGDDARLTRHPVAMFVQPTGIDRYHVSARLDAESAYRMRNLMFDEGNYVSRLGTDFLGSGAASFVVQVVDVIRQGKKKVTIRFCTRHIEIYSYALGAWTSYPVPLTGGQDDFFAYTGWANKLLFSNGVDGLWEFDLQTRVVALVPEGPSAKHLTTFGNRVVASSTVEDSADWPYRVRWTAKNDYKRWAESTEAAPLTPDLAGGYEDLFGSPGGLLDEAMGVFPYSDEQAWLVRSRSVWQMSVSGNVLAPFRFSRILADIGSPFRQSIVSLASGVVFLSRDNIHHLSVEGQELLGQPIVDEIAEEVTDKGKSLNVAFGAYDVGRSEYRLALDKLVWRYRFIEKGWTLDEYPWEIKALGRQIQGITGLPIDALEGIIDDLTSSGLYPPGTIDSLVKDRSTDNAMMFVPEASTYVMVETDASEDHELFSGQPTDSQLLLETGVLNLDALKAIELHGIHGEYETFEDQDLIWEFSENDGFAWNPLSLVRIEITEGSEIFFLKQERRSRKLRIRMRTGELGKLRLLGIAPELVNVERTMATRKPKPASISILPSSLSLVVGGTQQLSWQVLDSSGHVITGVAVSFLSSNSAIATVSSSGLVRALAPGSFSIVGTTRNIQTVVQGTVAASTPAPVAAILVTPDVSQGAPGTTQQFTATLRDAQNNILVGRTVVWASSTPGFATVNAVGLVTLVDDGVTVISATAEGVTGAATLTVVTAVVAVATVQVVPATFSGEVGDVFNLIARPLDVDGNLLSGKPVSWTTSNGSVASVSASGVVTLVGVGSVTITATCESTTGTSVGTSVAAPVAVSTVTVTPGSFTVFPGTTQTLTVVVKDSLGNVLTGRLITFASSNTSIATVNSSGVVTGVAVGNATITVTSEGKNAFSTGTVAQSPVASVTIAPLSFSLVAGNTVTLVATPRDSSGNALTGRTITWGSNDITKATVSSSGIVTGVAAGSVTITATSETKFGTSLGTITSVVLVASPLDSPSTTIYVPRPAMWDLPRVFLDSRYNRGGTALVWALDTTLTDTGNATTNTTNLQTQIDAAATRNGHTRIKLPNGWVGNQIRLRKHTLGPFWTYIEAVTKPSAEGVRALTSVMSAAPQIRSTTTGSTGAVWCDMGADYTRFVGIRFLATVGSPCYRLLYLQGTPDNSTENADTTPDALPQWMIVDRCWVDGGNVSRVVNGIAANTREFCCVDSVIDGVYFQGIENHGINGYTALGPWKIVGNVIEAGSISVLVGGADPHIVGLQTSDIEVRRNYMYKRASWNLRDPSVWDGVASKVVKNIFELKFADRVLVEGNVFENSFYGDNQIGAFLVWKVENSNGGNVTATTQNVTYRFNRAKNVAGGYEFQGVGVSAGPVGAPLHRVHHQHNLVEGLAPDTYVGGTTRAMFLNNAAADIVVDHDTLCLHQQIPTSVFRQPILFAGTTDEVRLVINNSLLMVPISSPPAAPDSRGIFGDGSQTVSPDNAANTLAQYAPGYSFLNNVMVKLAGSATSGYPPTSRYTDTIASVGCVSPATGNFALASTSPYKGICADGSNPGCDMALVNTATNGVASVPVTCGLVSDHNQRNEPTGVARPAYQTPVTDPTYGTTVTRITGDPGTPILTAGAVSLGTWSTINTHNYSKDPVWNADQTLMVLKRVSALGVPLFLDGSTYVPVFTRSYPSGTAETRWSSTDPDVMMVITSAGVLKSWNVRTNAVTTVYTAAGYSGCGFSLEGDFSTDMRYVAIFATRTSDSKLVGFVIDTVALTKTPDIDLAANGITSTDVVGVSALGTYIVVTGSITGATTVGGAYDAHKVFATATGAYIGQFFSEYGRPSHYDHAVDLSGNEVIVGVSKSPPDEGKVIMRRLSNGLVTVLNEGGYAAHTSCRNTARAGWAYVSHSYNGPSWPPYRDEVFAVKLDVSTTIQRYCNLHTLNTVDYDAEPHSCPTPDGKRIIFASDWESGTNRPSHAFVVDARVICP